MRTPAKAIEALAPNTRDARKVAYSVERALALALALLLIRSSFAHLGNPYYFLSTVYAYEIVGMETGRIVAAFVPFLQLLIGVCLLGRWWTREAYLLTGIIFLVFLAAQASALRRGLDISCGCFGASESLRIGWRTLLVGGAALSAASLGAVLAKTSSPALVSDPASSGETQ